MKKYILLITSITLTLIIYYLYNTAKYEPNTISEKGTLTLRRIVAKKTSEKNLQKLKEHPQNKTPLACTQSSSYLLSQRIEDLQEELNQGQKIPSLKTCFQSIEKLDQLKHSKQQPYFQNIKECVLHSSSKKDCKDLMIYLKSIFIGLSFPKDGHVEDYDESTVTGKLLWNIISSATN